MTEEGVVITGKHPAWQVHKRLYNWVLHWAKTKYGFIAMIVLAITEPICVPIPLDILVIGMSLGKPKSGIKYGVTGAMFSALGGTIAFLLGMAIGGENVAAVFDKIHLGSKVTLALEMYQKYDFWAVAISALTPVPYILFSWLGGMAEVSIVKFVIVSIVFRTMRFGSEGVLFYFFGERAEHLIEKHFNLATILVMVFLGIIAFLMNKLGAVFTP